MNPLVMHNRWIRYAAVVAGWAFLGLVLSIEVYFNNRAGMKMGSVDFLEVAIPQFGRAVMWALMAPLILQMREKMPLSRGGGWGGIGFHLAMSFVVMATDYLGGMVAYVVMWWEFSEDFGARVLECFYGR